MNSTLRLFKALPIPEGNKGYFDTALAAETFPLGFVFAPEIVAHYPSRIQLIQMVEKLYGHDSRKINQSFHKSWEKVRTSSLQVLVREQALHYLTTYGFERAGIYDPSTVFVPGEVLDAPELQDGIRLVVIRGLTLVELKLELLSLLSTGIALSEETIADALDVASTVGINVDDLKLISNREVKAALYDHLGVVPNDPVEFLRFVIYRVTGKTLLIKNHALTGMLRESDSIALVRYFNEYEKNHGLEPLAQIFYRFKPLFLAMRTNTRMRQIINRINRLAPRNHKPMGIDVLNSVTASLANGVPFPGFALHDALNPAPTFRKIRLAYALKYRTNADLDSIVYQIRNGKSYATDFHFRHQSLANETLDWVMYSIISDLLPRVKGKRIYIPEGIRYGLPATEKQFSGNVPSGTSVEVQGGLVAGIHWENQGNSRIDLDLSLQSVAGKLGWDAGYRSQERDVLFSGDMTDAPVPDGASEFFSISPEARGTWLMSVNFFNHGWEKLPAAPFQILVAAQNPRSLTRNHTIDPNSIKAQTTSSVSDQKTVGLIIADDKSTRFFFSESAPGGGRTARSTKHSEQARKALWTKFDDTISLNEVLAAAGGIFVSSPAEADIDLSLETIDKTSLIKLIAG